MSNLNTLLETNLPGDIIEAAPNLLSIPSGYIKCDGGVYPKSTYPNLTDLSAELHDLIITNPLPIMLNQHQTTVLADGRILVTGGYTAGAIALNNTYFGTVSGNIIKWVAGTALSTATRLHQTTVLPDGRILLTGGYGTMSLTYFGTISGNTISWVAGTALPGIIHSHQTTLLPDGRILVSGGNNGTTQTGNTYFGTISGNTISWVASNALAIAVEQHQTTLLPDGRILVSGGYAGVSKTDTKFGTISGNTINWLSGTQLPSGRRFHQIVVLPDGRILITGGYGSSTLSSTLFGTISGNTITWDSGSSLNAPVYGHQTTTLSDGRILVTGGYNTYSTEISYFFYPTYSNFLTPDLREPPTFSETTAYPASLYNAAAVTLPDGRILVTGGTTSGGTVYSNLTYFGTVNGNTITWVAGTVLPAVRTQHSMVVLSDGRVLVTAGWTTAALSTSLFGTISGNTITWTVATNAGTAYTARYNHFGGILPDGRLITIGGFTTAANAGVWFGTISGDTITWATGTSLPAARDLMTNACAILPDGRILVAGGATATTYIGTIDSTTNTTVVWKTGSALPDTIQQQAIQIIDNDNIVSIAGYNTVDWVPTIHYGNITSDTINFRTIESLNYGASCFAITKLLDGRIVIIGGKNVAANVANNICYIQDYSPTYLIKT